MNTQICFIPLLKFCLFYFRHYACGQCEKIFTAAKNLKRHEREAHQGMNYTCEDCGSTSTRKSSHKCILPKHPHENQCVNCGKMASDSNALEKHSVGCKRKRCELCDEPVIGSMKVHNNQCPELQCSKCEKRFDRKSRKDAHVAAKCSGKKCSNCDELLYQQHHRTSPELSRTKL